jgi:excisionase family DNA binding protein
MNKGSDIDNAAEWLRGSRQISEYVGHKHPTALRLIKDEGLPAVWVRGRYTTTKAAVDAWMNNRLVIAAQQQR